MSFCLVRWRINLLGRSPFYLLGADARVLAVAVVLSLSLGFGRCLSFCFRSLPCQVLRFDYFFDRVSASGFLLMLAPISIHSKVSFVSVKRGVYWALFHLFCLFHIMYWFP